MRPLLPLLLRALLFVPQRVLPGAYEFYTALVVPRGATARALVSDLARRPEFRPHYVYLNLHHALAIDPSTSMLVLAEGRVVRHVPVGSVATLAGRGRGFGYRLRIETDDGLAWEAKTLISVEPLVTAYDLLALALGRARRGEPPLRPQPMLAGPNATPAAT